MGICAAIGVVTCEASKHFNISLANVTGNEIELNAKTIIGTLQKFDCQDTELYEYEQPLQAEEKNDVVTTITIADVHEAIPGLQINTDGLDEKQIHEIGNLILKFKEVFSSPNFVPGNAQGVSHAINTGDARPINCAPYRAGVKERELIAKLTEEMLRDKVVRASSSPWASPVVLVEKKDKTMRFCVDYRKLNSITVRDAYPLPRIDQCLGTLNGNKFFSNLDLTAGYWQIPMVEEDKQKTAFITNDGLFEFNVLSFGLVNAPATFQRYMDMVVAGLKWKNLLVYLDDICIFSKSFEEHLVHLTEVLERLRAYNLRLKPTKCNFFSTRI